jgi:hypothetical protein
LQLRALMVEQVTSTFVFWPTCGLLEQDNINEAGAITMK